MCTLRQNDMYMRPCAWQANAQAYTHAYTKQPCFAVAQPCSGKAGPSQRSPTLKRVACTSMRKKDASRSSAMVNVGAFFFQCVWSSAMRCVSPCHSFSSLSCSRSKSAADEFQHNEFRLCEQRRGEGAEASMTCMQRSGSAGSTVTRLLTAYGCKTSTSCPVCRCKALGQLG